MFELLITMVEKLGILVMIAFILTRFPFFRDMICQEQLNRKQQVIAIVFFGFFGIIDTYSGLTLSTDNLQFNRWISAGIELLNSFSVKKCTAALFYLFNNKLSDRFLDSII